VVRQNTAVVKSIIIRHSVLIITQEKINLTLSTLDIIEEGKPFLSICL